MASENVQLTKFLKSLDVKLRSIKVKMNSCYLQTANQELDDHYRLLLKKRELAQARLTELGGPFPTK